MQKRLRVFLDTSALLAGFNSPTGAAGVIVAACFSRDIIPIISPQIIEEAERNIASKFPGLADAWRSFFAHTASSHGKAFVAACACSV